MPSDLASGFRGKKVDALCDALQLWMDCHAGARTRTALPSVLNPFLDKVGPFPHDAACPLL